MKNSKIFGLMAMVMVFAATTLTSCNKDFDNVSKSTLPQVPTDVEMTWRAMGNKDSVRVIYNGGSFVAAAPRMNGGNTYMRQGNNPLTATGDTTVALTGTTASVVFAHNYGISDTISVDLGIDVVVMRWNPATGQTEPSNEKVYPAEKMGIFENIEKTHPQEANGFYEINAMRYTLAEVSNPSLIAGRVSSKATIYELSSDTVIVRDTVVVTDTVNGGTTPTRNFLYADTTVSHISVDPNGVWDASASTLTWKHLHRITITRHYDAAPFTEVSSNDFNRYYPYLVTRNGQAMTSMIGSDVNLNGNGTADFTGYDVTLTAQSPYSSVNNDINCPFTLQHATMTANGPRVYGMSEGTQVNGLVPETLGTTPTTQDTTVIFGNIKYVARHYSAVDYFCGAAGDGWYILVIDENNNWYTSPDASTASGLNFTLRGTLTASEYAHIVSVSNFTAADMSGNRKCAAWCRNSTAGATANVISVVEYHPNGGNPQIKYRNMSGALIGVCSAATGTIEGHTVPEPVSWGGVMTSFTLGGGVVK